MQDLRLTECKFNPDPRWEVPLASTKAPMYVVSDLFDQNGYDLCYIEQLYAVANSDTDLINSHRPHRTALRQKWMDQKYKEEGAVLNHALLFERKGYTGRALEQLQEWAKEQPAYHKLINIRPKWGLDFSMDFYDKKGRTFEVLHWEYDSFEYQEVIDIKQKMDGILSSIDWDDAAEAIWSKKDEWYHLDFFKQSDYKCEYFGIIPERWKMVIW